MQAAPGFFGPLDWCDKWGEAIRNALNWRKYSKAAN
jgi:hypothetical protein